MATETGEQPAGAAPIPAITPPEGTAARVLDAAFSRFAAQGIKATTMAQLAEGAGISRVWLYRHFANKDAVVAALLVRESNRFQAGLLVLVQDTRPAAEVVTDAFVQSVTTLRSHPVLRRILDNEPEVVGQYVVNGIGPLLRLAIDGIAAYLSVNGAGAEPEMVAETLVRLVVFALLNNDTTVDYDDPAALRRYAAVTVRSLLAEPELRRRHR